MDEIPGFDDAVRQFKAFLVQQNLSPSLVWVFREDFWQQSPSRAVMRWLPPEQNGRLAKKVYSEGRAKGLVEIVALAPSGEQTNATRWYTKFLGDENQWWAQGLKFTISEPRPVATRIPRIAWVFAWWFPRFRNYQRRACFIGTRSWAEQPGR
jgi:hypothetical protein